MKHCCVIFDLHIQAASNKANQIIGIIRRTFSYLNRYCFIKLYKAMVRPHLEYGNTIWYPYLKRQSKTLNYSARMRFLRLPSLKFRRIRGDLIQVYKIMNGMDNLDWHDFFEKAAVNITRRSNNKLFVKFSKTNKRKNAFSNRFVPTWNALAEITKSALTLTALKKLLDADPSLNAFTYKYDE